MSFTFDWPKFSDQFHYDAIQMLNTALNKGNKPPVMVDKIEVVELQMGTQPPELEIRDIGELTMDQFRGIFRFTYSGDAHIVLKTKVQANPLNHKQPDIHLMAGSRGMLAAKQPLVVPMLLRLSHFKLNSYVVLVVSKQKGITLVFKTDPLQNVDINSTFDSIAVIQNFIQREIEGQLRQMFREDLPGIIHRLSQQWIKAKVEAPYLLRHPPLSRRPVFETMSTPDFLSDSRTLSSIDFQLQPVPPLHRRARSLSGASISNTPRRSNIATPMHPTGSTAANSVTSFPDLENYDPTYGLRPEGLSTESVFSGFSRLFTPNRGLADLAEEASESGEDDGEAESFDIVDWDNSTPDNLPTSHSLLDDVTEFEKIPAVGGGTVTRPRIYHSQSLVQTPSDGSVLPPPPLIPGRNAESGDYVHPAVESTRLFRSQSQYKNATYSASISDYRHLSKMHLDSMSDQTDYPCRTRSEPALDRVPFYSSSTRPVTPDSTEAQHSQSSYGIRSISTSPSSDIRHSDDAHIYTNFSFAQRRHSVTSDDLDYGSPLHQRDMPESDARIILRPSLNNTIHQLSTLSHSNHTLSPYTRSFAHFTVRSVPPRAPNTLGLSQPLDKQSTRAKRKRIYRISAKAKPDHVRDPKSDVTSVQPLAHVPPSEFDASDLDRYFRSQENYIVNSPDIHSTHVRRRTSRHQP